MTDLPISGELDVSVNEASLRTAKGEIEDEIDDLAIDVNVSGGGRGDNVRGREQAMSRSLLTEGNKIAQSALEEIELIQENVDEIADNQAGGGGLLGGGGGGIFDDLFGAGAETAGDAAVETGNQIADTISNTISTAVGDSISNAITGNSVSVENTPLEVEDTTLEVEDTTLSVEDIAPLAVDDPSPLRVEDPGPIQVDDTISIKSEPADREPLPVDRDPLPVEDLTVTIKQDRNTVRQPTGRSTENDPLTNPTLGEAVGVGAGTGIVSGGAVGSLAGGVGAVPGAIAGGTLGALGGAAGFAASEFFGPESSGSPSVNGAASQSGGPQPTVMQREISVSVDQNVKVSVDGKKLKKDILRETEAMIDDVQQQIDQLERDITG